MEREIAEINDMNRAFLFNVHRGNKIITLCLSFLPLSLPGERLFPPPSGLSYSTWFSVEHFSAAPHNHPVRLLTIIRRATSSEQHYVCLSVVLSAKDRSLTVSTKEELLQTYCKFNSSRNSEVVMLV